MTTCCNSSTFAHRPLKPAQVSQRIKSHFSRRTNSRSVTSLTASTQEANSDYLLCKTPKHQLYTCPQFKLLSHDKMLSALRWSNVCLNCLKPEHLPKNCGSNNHCRKCQKPHHTLLYIDREPKPAAGNKDEPSEREKPSTLEVAPMVSSHAQPGSARALLMTCWTLVHAPDGTVIKLVVSLTPAHQCHSLIGSDAPTTSIYLHSTSELVELLVCLSMVLHYNLLPLSRSSLC